MCGRFVSPEGGNISTCTIIVTNADDLLSSIHDRMPVIVDPEDQDRWLDPAIQEPIDLVPILKPLPSDELELYHVSARVNSPKNNSADRGEAINSLNGYLPNGRRRDFKSGSGIHSMR